MGKFLAAMIVVVALLAGAGIYYTQIYAFYDELEPTGVDEVELTVATDGSVETIAYSDFQAIDSDSSPIRFRACFTTDLTPARLSERYETYAEATPLTGPGWFDCYDAASIGQALEDGRAQAFLSRENLSYGVDRIIAVTEDGRGYIWHQLNECGETNYDGSAKRDDCPERPQGN